MSEKKQKVTGSCLCGKVKVNAQEMNSSVHACHCGMCRKWGGGVSLSVGCGAKVSFENEDNISVYRSSEWAERGFCKSCGSHLFYRLQDKSAYYIPVGVFNDAKGLTFEGQMFIDKKPAFFEFSNKTHNMTEAEVMAMFAEQP